MSDPPAKRIRSVQLKKQQEDRSETPQPSPKSVQHTSSGLPADPNSWESAFALDLCNDWEHAFLPAGPEKQQSQIGWVRQLIGVSLVLPEEKEYNRISKDIKFSDRLSGNAHVAAAHLRVMDVLLRSCIESKSDCVLNPIGLVGGAKPQETTEEKTIVKTKISSKPETVNEPPTADAFVYMQGGVVLGVSKTRKFLIGRSYKSADDGEGVEEGLSLNLKNLPGSSDISRKHACIEWRPSLSMQIEGIKSEPGNWWVTDLSSKLGIYLDNNLVKEGELKHGSVIGIGQHLLTFFENPK